MQKIPMADGGEGTVDALTQAAGGRKRACWVAGPLGEKTMAAYGLLGDGKTAVVEMSAAAGLPLLPAWKRDPFAASTWASAAALPTTAAPAWPRLLAPVFWTSRASLSLWAPPVCSSWRKSISPAWTPG